MHSADLSYRMNYRDVAQTPLEPSQVKRDVPSPVNLLNKL